MSDHRQFKRMVLGLPQNARDYAAVAAAAGLAELLGIGLAGLFVEDATLLEVAGLPCVRELRPLEGGWRPISLTQLAREIEHTAATARRLFDEATRLCTVETSFSLARGAAADVLAGQATADDILVIVEPRKSRRTRDAAIHGTLGCGISRGRGSHDCSEPYCARERSRCYDCGKPGRSKRFRCPGRCRHRWRVADRRSPERIWFIEDTCRAGCSSRRPTEDCPRSAAQV